MRTMKHWHIAVVSAALLVSATPAARAAEEHDRARRAYQAGEVVALGRILGRVRSTFEGRMLGIELNERRANRRPRWIYTVRIMTPKGHVITIRLDAKTMEVLNVRGRGADAARKRR